MLAGCMIRLEIKRKGKVVFVVDGGVVCRITTTGIDDTTDNESLNQGK